MDSKTFGNEGGRRTRRLQRPDFRPGNHAWGERQKNRGHAVQYFITGTALPDFNQSLRRWLNLLGIVNAAVYGSRLREDEL